MFYREIR